MLCGVISLALMMLYALLGQINIDKRGPHHERLGVWSVPLSSGLKTHRVFPQLILTKGPRSWVTLGSFQLQETESERLNQLL